MATAFRRPVVRWVSGGALTASLLAACGGGEVIAILQIVTPLAGAWNREGGSGALSFQGANDNDALLSSTRSVQVNMDDLPAACGTDSPLSGAIDSGRLTLFPASPASSSACIEGVFTNLRRLELTVSGEAAKRVYLNDRVAVNMAGGVWSSDDGATRLKFNDPSSVNNNSTADVTGCDVSDPAAKVAFKGTMFGFNTNTGARPSIPELLKTGDNSKLFTGLDYVDGDSITVRNPTGETVSLTRKNEQASCG